MSQHLNKCETESDIDTLNILLRDGEHALDIGKHRKAKTKLLKALRIDPNSISAQFYLALAELNMGHFKKAEKHARWVLRREPRRPNAHLNLGVIKIRQGDVASA